MARFKYLGEPPRDWVKTYGPCTEIKVPQKNGVVNILTPKAPNTEFIIGADLGYDITDQRSLSIMRVDSRYQEII